MNPSQPRTVVRRSGDAGLSPRMPSTIRWAVSARTRSSTARTSGTPDERIILSKLLAFSSIQPR